MGSSMKEHKVVDVRATGVMPGEVAALIQEALNEASADGWSLEMIQPIIYNSSTTGYFLLVFSRPSASKA